MVIPKRGITSSMDIPVRIFRSNMTSKCQVTIPKEIRDALGLKAGDRIGFELTPEGDARIVAADSEDAAASRTERALAGVREARQIYKAQGIDLGLDPAEHVDWVRGRAAEV